MKPFSFGLEIGMSNNIGAGPAAQHPGEAFINQGHVLDGRDYVSGSSWAMRGGAPAAVVSNLTRTGDGVTFNGSSSSAALPASLTPTVGESTGQATVLAYLSFDVLASGSDRRVYSSEDGSNGLWLAQTFNASTVRSRLDGDTSNRTAASTATTTVGAKTLVGFTVDEGEITSLLGTSFGPSVSSPAIDAVTHSAPYIGRRANTGAAFFDGDLFLFAYLPGVVATAGDLADVEAYAQGVFG